MRGFLRPDSRGRSALILFLLIAIAYGGSLWNGFVYDDALFMTKDPRVQSFSLLPRLFVQARWDFDQPDARPTVHHYYRPLEPLPYAVSHLFFHAAPWPSHLLHLLIHFANVLLVLAALRRLLGEESAALAGAAVFAVHPGYSEAALWVAAEGGLGAFLCTMAIFLLHTGPHGRRWYGRLSMAVLYLLALWFKETGVLAPVFVFLWDLIAAPDRGPRRVLRSLGHYALFVPPFVLYALLRRHALGDLVPTLYVPYTRWELVLNGVAQLPEYARSFLWPFHLRLYARLRTPPRHGSRVVLGRRGDARRGGARLRGHRAPSPARRVQGSPGRSLPWRRTWSSTSRRTTSIRRDTCTIRPSAFAFFSAAAGAGSRRDWR